MVNLGVCLVMLVLADVVMMKFLSSDSNESGGKREINNEDDGRKLSKLKRKSKTRSTSSSEGGNKGDDNVSGVAGDSLGMSDSSESDTKSDDKKKQKSTEERTGWRKWHRKCTRCIEDEQKKWVDPTISWICGAYQQARRSFKSECMMFYRNCQDGTMFTKIRNHRCPNDTANAIPRHGDHFFYEYKVVLSDKDKSDESVSSDNTESSSY